MTRTLDRLLDGSVDHGSVGLVARLSSKLERFSRRGFLTRTALVGSALSVDAVGYTLRPGTAYASICGPGSTASAGWTVFCCTINKGHNSCPPGSFAAGWWKAANSSWCGGGFQYIVDCNSRCTKCSSGCAGDHICSPGCQNCTCTSGSKHTCDQRRVCCNQFRYGQCNTHVRCSGGVLCRVLSCVAPYKWENCTTTSLRDDRTAAMGAPCLPGAGPILTKYNALNANGSYLKGSIGPERRVSDGRGRYVLYEGGAIYWSSKTGAHAVTTAAYQAWVRAGGPTGRPGYPTSDTLTGRPGGGWVTLFERGLIADSPTTSPIYVFGVASQWWAKLGREGGTLGYPVTDRTARGVVVGAKRTSGWVQRFQKGSLSWTVRGGTVPVLGGFHTKWLALKLDSGPLGLVDAPASDAPDGRGRLQSCAGGVLAQLGTAPVRAIYGPVYREWVAAGGVRSGYGWPVGDPVKQADGSWRCEFEHGALIAR